MASCILPSGASSCPSSCSLTESGMVGKAKVATSMGLVPLIASVTSIARGSIAPLLVFLIVALLLPVCVVRLLMPVVLIKLLLVVEPILLLPLVMLILLAVLLLFSSAKLLSLLLLPLTLSLCLLNRSTAVSQIFDGTN